MTAARQGQVSAMIDRLRHSVDVMEKTIAVTEERLSNVLRPATPTPATLAPISTPEPNIDTSHGLSLQQLAMSVERAEQRLSYVLSRLEV
jgi:hypothetical protein